MEGGDYGGGGQVAAWGGVGVELRQGKWCQCGQDMQKCSSSCSHTSKASLTVNFAKISYYTGFGKDCSKAVEGS